MPMRVPQPNRLLPKTPEQTAQNNILRIHMDKHSVIAASFPNDEPIKTQKITQARLLFFLPQAEYADRGWKIVCSFFKTKDGYRRTMSGKSVNPAIKKTQNRIACVHLLCHNEKVHSCIAFCHDSRYRRSVSSKVGKCVTASRAPV